MRRIDVVKKADKWVGETGGRKVSEGKTKVAAIKKTAKADPNPVTVKIHTGDGRLQEERTYRPVPIPRAARAKSVAKRFLYTTADTVTVKLASFRTSSLDGVPFDHRPVAGAQRFRVGADAVFARQITLGSALDRSKVQIFASARKVPSIKGGIGHINRLADVVGKMGVAAVELVLVAELVSSPLRS